MTGETGFVAQQGWERRGFFTQFAESEGGAGGVVRRFMLTGEIVPHVVHLVVEQRGFHEPGALEAPAGDGHFMDGEVLGGGGWGMLGDEGFVKYVELIAALVSETDRTGGGAIERGEAVAGGGVGGRAGFAFGRDRPVGFLSVGAVGGFAAFGGHTGTSLHGD